MVLALEINEGDQFIAFDTEGAFYVEITNVDQLKKGRRLTCVKRRKKADSGSVVKMYEEYFRRAYCPQKRNTAKMERTYFDAKCNCTVRVFSNNDGTEYYGRSYFQHYRNPWRE